MAEATERARSLGAAVLLEPRPGPVGSRSVIATPAGAELAFWEPRRGTDEFSRATAGLRSREPNERQR